MYYPVRAFQREEFAQNVIQVIGGTTAVNSRTLTLDNATGTTAACWEICVDIFDAFIQEPNTAARTVTLEADEHVISPDDGAGHTHGGDFPHNHGGTLTVAEFPAEASLRLTIGTTGWRYLAADRGFAAYSGADLFDRVGRRRDNRSGPGECRRDSEQQHHDRVHGVIRRTHRHRDPYPLRQRLTEGRAWRSDAPRAVKTPRICSSGRRCTRPTLRTT